MGNLVNIRLDNSFSVKQESCSEDGSPVDCLMPTDLKIKTTEETSSSSSDFGHLFGPKSHGQETHTAETSTSSKPAAGAGRREVMTFICSICGKGCMNGVIHRCPVCEKSFSSESNLNAHVKTHVEVEPYKCSVCGKRLSCKQTLNAHMRNHLGVKPYKCSLCGKCYTVKSSLKTHMEIHLEIQHKCSECGKCYTCSECGKCFPSRFSLNMHQMTSHMRETLFITVSISFSHIANIQYRGQTLSSEERSPTVTTQLRGCCAETLG
uniref:C2H2-type domain-containing protein n=1 Tax=Leptobrachium leishanense TaxID=445787 RepID=A0A8C5PFL4_9ANUR